MPYILYFKYQTEIVISVSKIQKSSLFGISSRLVGILDLFLVREKKKPKCENFQKYLFSTPENKNPYVKEF